MIRIICFDTHPESERYIKMANKWDKVEIIKLKTSTPQKEWDKIQEKIKGTPIYLDEQGKLMDSKTFSMLLEHCTLIIGSPYGLDPRKSEFKQIALSPMTMTSQLTHLVLCEQVYRGLSIRNGHPYHKN